MPYNVSASFAYTIQEPSTLLLSYLVHRSQQNILSEIITVSPQAIHDEMNFDIERNRFHRIKMNEPGILEIIYSAIVETDHAIPDYSNTSGNDEQEIVPEIFPYLLPSRYCQSDQLFRFANHEFGSKGTLLEKVNTLTEWIHDHVEYLSGSTDVNTSAYDTVTQQAGVCRDFAHLGIALCRALTIPARYCTVYACQLVPQDFHACFEAFIDNQWMMFDATKLAPINGFVKIAMGRDAADVAVSNLFGGVRPDNLEVTCEWINL